MNFVEAIQSGFNNYANFSGRASRSEFWFWVLFAFLVGLVTGVIDLVIFPGVEWSPINTLASLALMVPGWAVGARRLHDIGRSGWWQLIALTIIGIILLIVWWCFKGDDGPNDHGPDPLGAH